MNDYPQIRSARRLAALFLGLSALAFSFCMSTAVAGTPPSGEKRPPAPLYWGAQIGDHLTGEAAPWDMSAVDRFVRMTKKKPSLISFSTPWANCRQKPCEFYSFPTTPLENVHGYGAIPMLNWSSEGSLGSRDPNFRLKRIIRGDYDDYIRYFANATRDWGHPLFLRFDWEMNGFWFPWSDDVNGNHRGQFVAAWRHVHDIFRAAGADNATWVWCPNVDFTRKLQPLNQAYPGDAYVDWTCMDGFNWGETANSPGWMSFKKIFSETYHRILKLAPHKPMMIGEVASDTRGGSKPDWIRGMLKAIPGKFRKIRALVWFETEDQGMHWGLNQPPAAAKAFARGISRGIYRSNVFDLLPPLQPIRPPSR